MYLTGIRILCGLPHNEGSPRLNSIVVKRYDRIYGNMKRRTGEYLYSGCRTHAANVADRFSGNAFCKTLADEPWEGWRGKLRYAWACVSTWAGWQDDRIELTWHERAAAEWWYANEIPW